MKYNETACSLREQSGTVYGPFLARMAAGTSNGQKRSDQHKQREQAPGTGPEPVPQPTCVPNPPTRKGGWAQAQPEGLETEGATSMEAELPRRTSGGAHQRRVQVIEIPRGTDEELAAMASIVATMEALGQEAQCRIIHWAFSRYHQP